MQSTMCSLEQQSVCQKHCATSPLLMVIQMCFDALQPELPDLHRAQDRDSVYTEQLCTAHTLNQMPPGWFSFPWIACAARKQYIQTVSQIARFLSPL